MRKLNRLLYPLQCEDCNHWIPRAEISGYYDYYNGVNVSIIPCPKCGLDNGADY
jgi:hypothetical protein